MDIEKDTQPMEYLKGFSEFSEYIGTSRELTIFRRFDTLAARNLLYLQGQLIAIESCLKRYDEDDKKVIADGHRDPTSEVIQTSDAARDWESFLRSSSTNEHQKRKMEKILELRDVMKQYQEALHLHSIVLQLPSPEDHVLAIMKQWFEKKRPFLGIGGAVFDNIHDIVSLRSFDDQDRLSRCIQATFGYFFQERRRTPPSWGEIYYYPQEKVTKLVSLVTVLIASSLLIGAIAGLNYVPPNNRGMRLAIVGAFTFVFATTVGLLTNAKRSELFAAVAGYSAVLVVFASVNTSPQ